MAVFFIVFCIENFIVFCIEIPVTVEAGPRSAIGRAPDS